MIRLIYFSGLCLLAIALSSETGAKSLARISDAQAVELADSVFLARIESVSWKHTGQVDYMELHVAPACDALKGKPAINVSAYVDGFRALRNLSGNIIGYIDPTGSEDVWYDFRPGSIWLLFTSKAGTQDLLRYSAQPARLETFFPDRKFSEDCEYVLRRSP
jgi:hypothetical protein